VKSASEVRESMGISDKIVTENVEKYCTQAIWPRIEEVSRAGSNNFPIYLRGLSSREINVIKDYLEGLGYYVSLYEYVGERNGRTLTISW